MTERFVEMYFFCFHDKIKYALHTVDICSIYLPHPMMTDEIRYKHICIHSYCRLKTLERSVRRAKGTILDEATCEIPYGWQVDIVITT